MMRSVLNRSLKPDPEHPFAGPLHALFKVIGVNVFENPYRLMCHLFPTSLYTGAVSGIKQDGLFWLIEHTERPIFPVVTIEGDKHWMKATVHELDYRLVALLIQPGCPEFILRL